MVIISEVAGDVLYEAVAEPMGNSLNWDLIVAYSAYGGYSSLLKLGIIGLNEGNGHPFSFAALFNGYDPIELAKRCPFGLIKEYLPRDHRNEVFIDSAKVTHIWTQDRRISEDVAKVSLIPYIVDHYTDFIGEVDGVILARDDPWNHLEMSEPFLQVGLPLFIDKQLVSNKADLKRFLELTGLNYPLMAGSSIRFTRELASAKKNLQLEYVKTVHGVSRVSWMRYGHHLFEGIACLWGLEIDWVRSLCDKMHHDIIQIHYKSGLNVILEFIEDAQLPIQFTCYSVVQPAYTVPFQDFFHSFREMMMSFVSMINSNTRAIPYDEIVEIAKIILAGDISKHLGCTAICPATLEPYTS